MLTNALNPPPVRTYFLLIFKRILLSYAIPYKRRSTGGALPLHPGQGIRFEAQNRKARPVITGRAMCLINTLVSPVRVSQG
jgi:hypothetical protein